MTIGVVGLGLIGGSIGLALRDPDHQIIGFDPSEANSKLALDRFCSDRLGTLEEVSQAEVVFVAAPPAKVVEVLTLVCQVKGENTIVTDCTSVKRPVADWAMESKQSLFVPGHPMAGHEKSGPGFASAWMFRGAKWIISPLPITDEKALKKVEELAQAMGAIPVRIPADHHDRHVAVVSHLPHALAGLLVQLASELDNKDISGGSWRDLTRVGGVDPGLWTQIFLANRVELGRALGDMAMDLAKLQKEVVDGDEEAIFAFFKEAQKAAAKQKVAQAQPETAVAKGSKVRKRT
jgi:prephenate dehydrogenase